MLGAVAVAFLFLVSSALAKKPNIVFIVSDDLGYDDVYFASKQILTPNIDSFREQGQFLEWYYGQSVCSATRSVFLTGRYPLHTGINGWIHPDQSFGVPLNFPFLSDILKNYGKYDTHAIGKWHLGFYKWDYTPTYRGFNSFYGYYTGGEDYFTHITNNYYDFRNDSAPNCGANCSNVATDAYEQYSARLFSEEAINVIKRYNETYGNDDDTPLFLYLAYQSVHSPNDVPPRYENMYGGNKTGNPNYIANSERRIFAGMVTCMDEGIGNVTNALKKYGLFDDNLIVVFTSDNGGPIPNDDGGDAIGSRNWPLRGGKHSIWEGGTRITGVVWSTPDIIPRNLPNINGNYSQLMHAADWLPTILDAVSIDATKVANISDIDGVSQWDGILGKYDNDNDKDRMGAKFDVRSNIFYGRNAYSDPANNTGYQSMGYKILNNTGGVPDYWYAPVSQDTSYVEPYNREQIEMYFKENGINSVCTNGSDYMLFNLTNDPCERNDISSSNAQLVSTLLEEMNKLQATGVPTASNDPTCSTSNIPHPTYPVVGGVWEPWC